LIGDLNHLHLGCNSCPAFADILPHAQIAATVSRKHCGISSRRSRCRIETTGSRRSAAQRDHPVRPSDLRRWAAFIACTASSKSSKGRSSSRLALVFSDDLPRPASATLRSGRRRALNQLLWTRMSRDLGHFPCKSASSPQYGEIIGRGFCVTFDMHQWLPQCT